MTRVIVINGTPEAGKDTFVRMMGELLGVYKVFNVVTSDPVKNLFTQAGWEGEKTPEIRDAMYAVKEIFDSLFDMSYTYTRKQVEQAQGITASFNVDTYVFIHAREPKNIKRYVEDFNATALFIDRPDKRKVRATNKADNNVTNYVYDYVIRNDGTLEELKEKVGEFLRWLT